MKKLQIKQSKTAQLANTITDAIKGTLFEFSTPSNDVTVDENKNNTLKEVTLGNKLKR